MGPGDPFASRTASPDRPAADARSERATGPASPSAEEPVRIQARPLERTAPPRPPAGRATLVGALAGLGLGLLFVLLSPGQAVLVLVLTAIGAAIGAIGRSFFADGVDLGAAWQALRRR